MTLAAVWAASAAAAGSPGPSAQGRLFSAAEIQEGWILDGAADRTVLGERELKITADPPHLLLEVEGTRFAELVDHRQQPLDHGAIGFRCMTEGRTFQLRNVNIEGRVEPAPE